GQLANARPGECSAAVRSRVEEAVDRQLRRGGARNGELSPRELRHVCRLDAQGEVLLRSAFRRLGLSARAWHRILRMARTVADLAGSDAIRAQHVAESIQYRSLDRSVPSA